MKINHFPLLLLIVILVTSSISWGQQPNAVVDPIKNKPLNFEFCSFDFFHNEKMKNDPVYKMMCLKTFEDVKKISSKTSKKAAGGVIQIPLVVHVMHQGEAIGSGTNISDDDVKLGIKTLNDIWRKVSGTVGESSSGVDMKIEFALAVQDPNGNPTNGIVRVDLSGVPAFVNNGVGTNGIPFYDAGGGINSLKEYSNWDPTRYYNLHLVEKTEGSLSGGGAFLAGAHGLPYDGTILTLLYFLGGEVRHLAHEMGHAFNLPHTFSDSNPSACADGDGIFDTPRHRRPDFIVPTITDCDLNGTNDCDPLFDEVINPDTGFRRNSGRHQDHLYNLMGYGRCALEFTGGQRTVCYNTLQTIRASFLTSPALTPVAPATVFFTTSPSANVVCLGNALQFRDESTSTPNSYTNAPLSNITFLWTFNNNVNPPFTSTLQNPLITFTNPGLYDVTLAITNSFGTTSLKKQNNIVVTSQGVVAACSISSRNNNNDYGVGVSNFSFNSINNPTSTFIPANAKNNFICSQNTSVFLGTSYPLTVNYRSRDDGRAFLEVWIDWDNNGIFQTSNSNGISERVLTDNIAANSTKNAKVSITPTATATLNTLLRMRVISEFTVAPGVCNQGYVQRADDYGVFVRAACTPPAASITNNSGTTVLTCAAPSISLTASGGVSYLWNNNKGITPTIAAIEPGTYTVTVTSVDGCTATNSIVITENKSKPTAVITNNTAATTITCSRSAISVTASGGVSYIWDNGLGNNATASITVAGTYTVTVTGANGCTDSQNIVITENKSKPAAVITNNTGATIITCLRSAISVTASGGVSYIWDNDLGSNATASITVAGTYTVTVTGANGCTDSQNIVITENKSKPAAVITNNTGATIITCLRSAISVTASGGDSYIWDNDLGSNATASITVAGTYTVTVTGSNGCTDSQNIVITSEIAPTCLVSSFNNNNDFGCGVTNVLFNNINKTTTTFIPATARQDFVCSNKTFVNIGTVYDLDVTYQSRSDGSQFLEVWIDWDNNGIFQTSNSNGVNERVLIDNIAANVIKTATVSITPPSTATLDTLLRLRVISESNGAPGMCNQGYIKRADDYGVVVNSIPITIWNGSVWSSGIPTATVEAIIDATYNTNVGGVQVPFTTKKLTINSTKSLTINSETTLIVQNEVINKGSLVIENNANLIQINNTSNTGFITVNRNSSPLRRLDYTLWSAPVQGQQLQGFSPETVTNRFYVYNSTTNLYNSISPTSNFAIGKGYLIRTPNTHPETPTIWNGSYTGIPNNGFITFETEEDKTPIGVEPPPSGNYYPPVGGNYYAIGNPYPSTISADAFIDANSLSDPLYFWRKTNNAAYSSYATYTKAGGTSNSGGLSSIEPNGTIQVGQGFIAKTTSSTFTFSNAMRIANTYNQFLKAKAIERHRIWLNLTKESEPVNQMMIAYMSGATSGIDNAIDGRYFGDSTTALNSIIENQEFIIQAKGLPFENTDVVPLTFKTNTDGNYNISIDHVDGLFVGNQDIYLKDNQLGLTQNLKENSHSFASSAGTFNKRFEIVYKNNASLSTENPRFNNNTVLVFQKDKSINVESSGMELKDIIVYDILGRKILEKLDIYNTSIKINLKVSQQVLVLKITNQNNETVTKKIIQ